MPNPTARSYVGLGLETTKFTGVVPTDFLPVDKIDPFDNVNYIEDKGLRGSMVGVYDLLPGNQFAEIDLSGPLYPDTFGFLLAGVLGEVAFSSGTPNTHTMTIKNSGDGQAKALSVSDYYGMGSSTTRRFTGCQVSELNIKYAGDGMLTYDAKLVGKVSGSVANPTASFSTVQALPAWRGTLSIASSSKNFLVDGELNIKRNVEPIDTVNGSADPYVIWQGPVDVSGKFTYVHEDDVELARYLQATTAAVVLDFTQGAGASQVGLNTTMTKCQYRVAKIDRSKDFVATSIEFQGIPNTTDVGASGGYGPAKFIIKSAKPTSTYQ